MPVTPRDGFARYCPQFDLQIDVRGAHLAPPTDAEIGALARSAAQPGAVLPDSETYFVKWLHGRTPIDVERQRAERMHQNRELTKRPGWTLDLGVIVDRMPVGLQSISGFDQWPQRRVVGTTSWLLAPFQRSGLGTRCRAAVLELAFTHLDAEVAKSWALEDNLGSSTVSTKLGYELVDRHVITENGGYFTELVYQIDKSAWLNSSARQRYLPTITGADALVTLLAEP